MRVALFVTCVNDMLYPGTGQAVVRLLERLGVEVDFPAAQTCCGQPQFNTGYRHETEPLVRRFAEAFAGYDARGHAVRVVRGDGARQLPADRAKARAEGRGGSSRRAAGRGAEDVRADGVPGGRAGGDGRRRVLPAHRHLPPHLPRAAHAAGSATGRGGCWRP